MAQLFNLGGKVLFSCVLLGSGNPCLPLFMQVFVNYLLQGAGVLHPPPTYVPAVNPDILQCLWIDYILFIYSLGLSYVWGETDIMDK